VVARALAAAALLLTASPAPLQEAAPSDGARALASLHERVFARPFYAVARVTRAADGQEDGASLALLHEGRLHLDFPDADLVMDLPTGMGSERLFGLDITMQDLLALGGDPELFDVRDEGADTVAGRATRRLVLTPRRPQDSFDDAIMLWLDPADGTPVRLRAVAAGGRSVRTIDFSVGDDDVAKALSVPSRWTCRTEGRRPGSSTAEFLLFEPVEGMDPRRFTPARLKRWR
jgi:hypothetical protein